MGRIFIKKKPLIDPTLDNLKKTLRELRFLSPDDRCDIINQYKKEAYPNQIKKEQEVKPNFITNPMISKSNNFMEEVIKLYEQGYDEFQIAKKHNCNIDFITSIIYAGQCIIAKPLGSGKLRPNTKIIREV